MYEIMDIIKKMSGKCSCGGEHYTAIEDIVIESGAAERVGEILIKNNFPKNLLLVADKNTLKAAEGIEKSLEGFAVTYKIYDDIRVATIDHVKELEEIIKGSEVAILSVGSGSVNDPCRLAAARQNKKLCIFATAPSMDGFASYGSPLVDKGFKATYAAKSPEVIIGETKILAKAPAALKSAGFGDMVAKYVAIIDWKISSLLTDEVYCEQVGALTKRAIDILMDMADKVTKEDEETAGKIFEALLMTGIGMSFMQNSRPASGSEHLISHILECVELRDNIVPNFHGEDVGVATLCMLKFYGELAEKEEIKTRRENVNWDDVYAFYGNMAEEVLALNTPDTITDAVNPEDLKENWQKIRDIIHSVPSYEECKAAMVKAGCKITVDDIGKDHKLFNDCIKYSPYMRRRLTLLRLRDMIVCGA